MPAAASRSALSDAASLLLTPGGVLAALSHIHTLAAAAVSSLKAQTVRSTALPARQRRSAEHALSTAKAIERKSLFLCSWSSEQPSDVFSGVALIVKAMHAEVEQQYAQTDAPTQQAVAAADTDSALLFARPRIVELS